MHNRFTHNKARVYSDFRSSEQIYRNKSPSSLYYKSTTQQTEWTKAAIINGLDIHKETVAGDKEQCSSKETLKKSCEGSRTSTDILTTRILGLNPNEKCERAL